MAELESRGGLAHSGHLDVTDQDSVNAFVADIAELYGRLDVLSDAAGRLDEADMVRFSELDTAAASALLQVDVIGAMRMCHAVRPIMLGRFGGPPGVVEDNAVVMGVVDVMTEERRHQLEPQPLVVDQLGTATASRAAKPYDHRVRVEVAPPA